MIEIKYFTFNPFQENTYLLINDKNDCIIIDPGCYFENERKELLDYIANRQLKVARLLNTHCHIDHVFGNKLVARTYGVGLEIHPDEQPVLDRASEVASMFNVAFEPSVAPAAFLKEGGTIKFGDDELDILLTPGHSPGSVSFYCPAQQFLIAGDVLFNQSIGRTDLPLGNHEQLLTSIRTQLFTLPDEVKVYPGHGPATTIGFEKANNPYVRPL